MLFNMLQITAVFASDDRIEFDLKLIADTGVVHRGAMEYGKFDSQDVIIVKPGYSNRQSGTTVVVDYVIPDYINASEYEYVAIDYYKTDNGNLIKFKPALDGKMTSYMHDAISDSWHRAVWKISPANKEDKRFNQFHFLPFDAQDANSISEERCYIKSITAYKTNPVTEAEIEFNNKIKEEILKNNQALKGVDEDIPVFEDLDKMKQTPQLIKNNDFEDGSAFWQESDAKFNIYSSNACEGINCVKVTDRKYYYSGIEQDITDVLNEYGPGDYRVWAFIRNDAGSPSTYFDYKLAVIINGEETSCSTFHIKEEWQKIDGAFRLNWEGKLHKAAIKISGVEKTDLADFYVDNVSMKKCLYNEEISDHKAYINGTPDGKFLPSANITRAEAVAMISRLMASEEELSGTSAYSDVSDSSWYCGNVAYMEKSGLLEYFKDEFKPQQPITRAEFVYLVNNISAVSNNIELNFTDTDENHPLYGCITDAVKNGIINGYEDNTIRPDDLITRAEAVAIINRALKRCALPVSFTGAKTVEFSDVNSSHWAYCHIVEASSNHSAVVMDKGDCFAEAWDVTAENSDDKFYEDTAAMVNSKAEELKKKILNAPDTLEISGTKYYVSNNGNDENTGTSPDNAWKTIDKVNSVNYKRGDAVLFERGGLWRGATVLCKSGVTYAAYGSGEKPKLYGSEKNYADPSLWEKTDVPNVWTTTEKLSNVGFLQFDGNIMSQKVFSADELNKNFNFMQEKYNGVPVLLYYDGENPGSVFENIEIAPEYSIFIADNKQDIRIDNICMKYTGWHGVKFANVENISITNCEVGWIGGTGGSPTSSKTRWGNGIEFWQNCKNILVDSCYLYQIYDSALTNQFKGDAGDVVVEENVTYTNNLVDYATYSFEFFMNQYNSNSAIMKDITFENNICRYAGRGWGQDNRPNKDTSSDVKGWHSINRTENFNIRNNIFYDALLLSIDFSSYSRNLAANTKSPNNKFPQYLVNLENNVYVVEEGKRFVTYNCFDYISGLDSNYDFVKDNIDPGAQIVLIPEDR